MFQSAQIAFPFSTGVRHRSAVSFEQFGVRCLDWQGTAPPVPRCLHRFGVVTEVEIKHRMLLLSIPLGVCHPSSTPHPSMNLPEAPSSNVPSAIGRLAKGETFHPPPYHLFTCDQRVSLETRGVTVKSGNIGTSPLRWSLLMSSRVATHF